MSQVKLTDADVARAKQLWADYQQQHDVSDRQGQAVGIDPFSGRVWFGNSGVDIFQQQRAEGIAIPVYLVRVGSDYYCRKGGRR